MFLPKREKCISNRIHLTISGEKYKTRTFSPCKFLCLYHYLLDQNTCIAIF